MTHRDTVLALDDKKLLAQCDVHTYRASGPGGQKRNKTDSAVRLRHRPTGIGAQGEESRSQHENKARALRRLRLAIALQQRDEVVPDTFLVPPILTECVSGENKLCVGPRDVRYPRVVGIVFDVLEAMGGRMKPSAELLGITMGSLNKFISRDPKLWDAANRIRQRFGLERLKPPK